ncbi:AIM24 family protein [Nocardioides vastitatis]
MTAAAWHPDPTGRHELRYWDGAQWTEHVSDQGVQSVSPLYPASTGGGDGGEAAGSHRAEEPASDAADAAESAESAESSDWLGGDSATEEPSSTTQAMDMPVHEPETAFAPRPSQPDASADAPVAEAPYGGQPPMGGGPPMGGQPPYAGQPAPGGPTYPGQQMGGGQAPGDPFAGISGDLIGGQFSEKAGVGAELQNKRLLRVRINEPFMAKQGSMVAYQGNVNFAYQGGGAAKFLKKAITGEGLNLMRVEGQGDVFLADLAHEVHILHLNNSGISANGKNVLAFSAALDWNVERVKGGSIAAGGLFNTTLRGTGWVAITTDGDPVVLNAAEAPTFADANALVAWSVHLQTTIKSSFTAGALIGRGSGEAFQVSFHGPGFVIVQPSEGLPAPPAS